MNKIVKVLVAVFVAGLFFALLTNFKLSYKANHCEDNLFLINQDLNVLMQVLKTEQIKFEAFKALPDSLQMKININEESKTVNFQLITISFEDNGKLKSIRH